MQMHDMNVLFFDQPEKCPEGCWIELSFIQDPDGDWAFRKELANSLSCPQQAGDNAEPIRVEIRQDVPVQTTSAVEAAVVTDVVDRP